VPVPEHAFPAKKLYETVPPAWKALVRVAESEAEPPTGMLGDDRLVVITGVALLTTRDLHALVIRMLFASPLYVACQLKVPVELKTTENGPAVPDANATILLATVVPEQVLPVNMLKVTVPVGLKPPDTVALALAEFPTTIVVAETNSETAGVALVTVRGKHALWATLLLASPL
jgi:hypothetical protein